MLGAIGGAVASGVLGYMGAKEQSEATEAANAANLAFAREQQAFQEKMAMRGIRFRVEDARGAGIHPLAALGANVSSPAPISVGLTPDTAMGENLGRMGQDINRALSSVQTAPERQLSELQIQSAKLDLDGKALDNQIKNSQLQKMNAVGPAVPAVTGSNFIPGQGNSGSSITNKNLERTKTLKGAPHSEPGAISDVGWAKTATGIVPIPSGDVKQRIEDNMPQEWMHYYRNNLSQNWGDGPKPPPEALPRGATSWDWHIPSQEFRPYYPQYKFETRKWKR